MITKSKTPGHFAPTPGKRRGRRIKPNSAETESGYTWQTCQCGTKFLAEAPGLCAVCDKLGSQPSAAERLLSVKTCDVCGETYGAELNTCPACAKKRSTGAASRRRQPPGAKGEHDQGADAPRSPSSSPAAPRALEGATFVDLYVTLDQIEVREQTREDFDEQGIKTLAASVEEHGLLQPPIVRRNYASAFLPYLLVAGERRIRALRLLGREQVKVRDVGEISDAQALTIQGIENLDRKDLNDVERAGWYQRMTAPIEAGGAGLTQEELAKREAVTQAEISNRIRILRAPEWARQLVISGQMSRKHCLELLRFEGAEPILDAIKKDTLACLKSEDGLGTAAQYLDEVSRVARNSSFALSGHDYDYRRGNVRFAVEPSEAEAAALEIVEVPDDNGEIEKRALNKKLAAKLLAKAKAAAIDAAEKKTAKSGKAQQAKTETLSPAEQKKKAAEQAQQHENRVDAWFHDWLRVLGAAWLKSGETSGGFEASCLTTWALVEQPVGEREIYDLFFAGAFPDRVRKVQSHTRESALELIVQLTVTQRLDAELSLAVGLLVDEDGDPRGQVFGYPPQAVVPSETVEAMARAMELDLAAAWRDDRKSAMRERFWELHAKDQLLALGQELGVPLLETQKKSVMVLVLLGQDKPLPLPKSLAGLVAKTTTAKKRGKK